MQKILQANESQGRSSTGMLIGIATIAAGLFLWKKPGSSESGDGDGGSSPGTPSQSQIMATTTDAQLEALRDQFEGAYSAGLINHAQYSALYTEYIRQGYYLDLHNRGGEWVNAALEFRSRTSSVVDSSQLYPVYQEIFQAMSGTSPTVMPESKFSNLHVVSIDGAPVTAMIEKRAGASWRVYVGVGHEGPAMAVKIEAAIEFPGGVVSQTSDSGVSVPDHVNTTMVFHTCNGSFGPEASAHLADGEVGTMKIKLIGPNGHELLAPVSMPQVFLFRKVVTPDVPVPDSTPIKVQLGLAWDCISGAATTYNNYVIWVKRNGEFLKYDSTSGTNQIGNFQSADHVSVYAIKSCSLQAGGKTVDLFEGWNSFYWN